MSDLDKLTREATTKAVIAVGRDAAKRATDKLLDDDDAPGEDENAGSKPRRRWKLIALVVLGLFLLVGLIGLLLNYWFYFLAAGVLGVGGLVGWSRLKKRIGARKPSKDRKEIAKEDSPAPESVRVRLASREAAPTAPKTATRADADAEAQALAEARATREHEVDDELAAMKARLKR
jgi:hypothetical protein